MPLTHSRRPARTRGELRLNPLYRATAESSDQITLRLSFPSEDYEQEYGACREYLPEEVILNRSALDARCGWPRPRRLFEDISARRRVVLDLPRAGVTDSGSGLRAQAQDFQSALFNPPIFSLNYGTHRSRYRDMP
jgi:hypothetical protein